MTINKAVAAGLMGNEISKKVAGTDEISVGRTAIATTAGGITGGVMAGTIVVTTTA